MTRHIVGKVLDVFGIEMPRFKRWDEEMTASARGGIHHPA
jgi:3-polyprenyl-4-hydroxybenzoate decarboxylase